MADQALGMVYILELSIKYSKENTKTPCLFKTGNKVVEVG
jgi:hypothetical protein